MDSINKYKQVFETISKCLNGNLNTNFTKLLVVSRSRSIEQILNLYNEGQRDFGEIYLEEIIEKSPKLPTDINWYMIGRPQTNKVKNLLSVPNLHTIESVDSIKLAKEINNYCHKFERNQLNIYLQINIRKDESKSGVFQEDILSLYEEIVKECDLLKIKGIMSLGDVGNTKQFEAMQEIKSTLCNKFNLNKEEFILSIGTSDDFEKAIEYGSNEVRIEGLLHEF